MNITVVSRSWPSNERSGVPMVAAEHVKTLVANGHVVSIVGANPSVVKEALPVADRFYVPSRGSGAIYSPARVDLKLLSEALIASSPDLVVIEAWQTALTDASVDVAHRSGIPVLMISHGVSVHPYSSRLFDVVRSLAWCYYRFHSLPRRIPRLTAMTTLDEKSSSKRFHDRDIARRIGIPIMALVNAPVHWRDSAPDFRERKRQVLVVGYFSEVKNQLSALDAFAGLPDSLQLRFIGQRIGSYYLKCVRRVAELGLESQVTFSQDDECNIADEIANSLVVLCTSITEALPVTLLEAMASGTPFVATPVGAIPSMGAGIIADNAHEQQSAILALINDPDHWTRLAERGRQAYRARYTQDHVRKNLLDAVSIATKATRAIRA